MTSPVQEELQEETLSPVQIAIAATAVYAALRASMVQQLLTLWYSLGSYGAETLQEFLELAIPLVEASREASVETTLSYMALQLESLGLDFGATPDLSNIDIRNGVSVEEVYGRPHKVVWTKLAQGVPFDLARDYGAERVRQLAETDLQLSHTNTSRRLLADRNDIVGFRRVPTGDYTCALCLIASTQRYRKFDLMPIHPGCDCRVAPIVSDEPTDQVLDRELLESLHLAVEDMFGFSDRSGRKIDYRKLLVVKDHGEYGPTLAKSGNHFTKLVLPE
jgi:hypothetical protein